MDYKYDVTTTKRSQGTNTKKYIMLHHTGGVSTLKNMTDYLSKNSAQVSAHYVVGIQGNISRIGTDDYILWHAGRGDKIPGVIDTMNNHSIGIEVVSNGDDFTQVQIVALAELVKDIQARHNISLENIIRHSDYSTRKWDIGDAFYKTVGASSYEDWLNNHIATQVSPDLESEVERLEREKDILKRRADETEALLLESLKKLQPNKY